MNPYIEKNLASLRQRFEALKISGSETRREFEDLKNEHSLGRGIPELYERHEALAKRLELLRAEYHKVSCDIEYYEKLKDHAEAKDSSVKSAPKVTTYLISSLLPEDDRDYVLGDLDEEFSDRCLQSGCLRAKLWYYRQAFSTVRLCFLALFRKVVRRRS